MTRLYNGPMPIADGPPVSVLPGTGAKQHTLANSVRCSGVGLHCGDPIAVRMHPAPADTGVRLRRADVPNAPPIQANWANVRETPLCTTLADGVTQIATVEHLLAALAAMGVDNADVEVHGPEVPIMDGSAAPFVFLIECAGRAPQQAARRAIRIEKPVTVHDTAQDRSAALAPGSNGLTLDVTIAFNSPAIGQQARTARLDAHTFKRDLARARTFGFLAEVDQLRAVGLALGGSLDNAVVIDDDRVLNTEGLRYPDEFVRHKMLDSVGDLFLAGAPIMGRYTGRRTGHALNRRLLAALFADPEAWSWIDDPGDTRHEAVHGAGPALPERAVAQRE